MTADQLMAKGTVTPAPLAGPSGVGAASAALTAPVGAGSGWPGPAGSALRSHASAASAVATAASQVRWFIVMLRPSGGGELALLRYRGDPEVLKGHSASPSRGQRRRCETQTKGDCGG